MVTIIMGRIEHLYSLNIYPRNIIVCISVSAIRIFKEIIYKPLDKNNPHRLIEILVHENFHLITCTFGFVGFIFFNFCSLIYSSNSLGFLLYSELYSLSSSSILISLLPSR